MTTTIDRQERVRRAIEFRRPDRVPVVFWNRDQTEGDVMLYHLALGAPEERKADGRWKMADGTSQHATPDSQLPSPISQPFAGWDWSLNEWGYRLVKSGDGTMGHPVEPVYRELPRAIKVGRDSVEPSSAKRRLDGV